MNHSFGRVVSDPVRSNVSSATTRLAIALAMGLATALACAEGSSPPPPLQGPPGTIIPGAYLPPAVEQKPPQQGPAAPVAVDPTPGPQNPVDQADPLPLLDEPISREQPPPPAPPPPPVDPNTDDDSDGFSENQGDCNDADPNSNPGAFDVAANLVDENCDGLPDNEPTDCDEGLSIEADDPIDAARALGICRLQYGRGWGLVGARWVFPNGSAVSEARITCEREIAELTQREDLPIVDLGGLPSGSSPHPLSRGILTGFGPNVGPRAGASLVAISSGIARPGQIDAPAPAKGTSPARAATICPDIDLPAGLTPRSESCGELAEQPRYYYDGIALELEIRAPTNANAFAFNFDFYTYEYPDFVCSAFNDYFAALLDSAHPSVPADGNISFDRSGNHVSVNAAFVEVCEPTTIRDKVFTCPLGVSELEGTGFLEDLGVDGFEAKAATGWLETLAPIVPGEVFTLRLTVWDAGDHHLDTTVLLDNFRWVPAVGAMPVPDVPVTTRPSVIR